MNKNFRNLTYCFYTYIGCLVGFALYVYFLETTSKVIPSNFSHTLGVAWIIIFISAWFLFLMNIGKLAAQEKKNVALWVLGAWLFNIIGIIVAYYRMKAIAIRNGWI